MEDEIVEIKKTKYYTYYQPNKQDIKRKVGDCSVRAISKALKLNWYEAYDMLCSIGREFQAMPNSKITYEHLLKTNNFKYVGISNKRGTKKPTVESFTKEHKTGTYCLHTKKHMVTVVDGVYYDTWNSGRQCLYGYWVKEETK